MAAPTLFKSSMNGFIYRESLQNYQNQLAVKNEHLITAQAAYEQVLNLVTQYNEKIGTAKEYLEIIKNELSESKESKKTHKLELQMKQYERFIETAPEKLFPITERLNLLAEDISRLENDISEIVELARESSISPSLGG